MLLPSNDHETIHTDDHDEAPIDSGPLLIAQGPSFEGGLLVVWGCGEFGQHGHGHLNDVHCADAVGVPLWLGQDRQLTSVACGSSHTLAITDDNNLYSWGNSNSGQLGLGTSHTNPQPKRVLLGVSSGTKLQGITCGTRHSFVWTEDGDAFSFGNNYSAQLGYDFRRPDFKENQLRPIFVDTLLHRPVHQVACGARHSVFLFKDGRVAAVGANNRGQLGTGDCVDSECPLNVPDVTGVCLVACGNSHSLVADGQGNVYSWGYGKACGSRTDILSPLCTPTDSNAFVTCLAGGDSHSVLLLSDGRVFTWGNNFEGQLGQGKAVKFRERPVEVKFDIPLDEKVVCISGGENTSAAVTESGQLFLWGKNASNIIRMDKGPRTFQYEPHPINLGTWTVHKVSCGSWHVACIVTSSGRMKHCKPDATNKVSPDEDQLQDQLHSENGLIEQQYHDIVSGNGKAEAEHGDQEYCETERQREINEEESQVVCEQWWIDNDDKNTEGNSPAQSDMWKITAPEQSDRVVTNGHTDKDEPRPDSDGEICGLPSWLHPETESDRNNDERCAPAEISEQEVVQHRETAPSQYSGNGTTTVSSTASSSSSEDLTSSSDRPNTFNPMEDPLSNKRPIPCGKPSDDGEFDEFEVCFETSLFKPAKEVRHQPEAYKRGNSTALRSTDLPKNRSDESVELLREDTAVAASKVEVSREESDTFTRSCEAVTRKESVGKSYRTRVMSDGPTRLNEGLLTGLENRLKSNSLTNVTLGFVYDSDVRVQPQLQQSASASPLSSRYFTTGRTGTPGQLNREKKAPRTLRRVSWDGEGEYCLPNQPMHTSDLTATEWQKRHIPQTPMYRTQSSPSLYSSNLMRSPPASAQVSPKVPRPPVSGNSRFPPRPPAGRKPGIRRPLFSSGTSWRTRK